MVPESSNSKCVLELEPFSLIFSSLYMELNGMIYINTYPKIEQFNIIYYILQSQLR
jgi:hypothetical protein